MVTSGLFQIKGTVKIRDSLDPSAYFRPSWKLVNGKTVYRKGDNGYVSFGTKYLSLREQPEDSASLIPYEDIRKIELEDEKESAYYPVALPMKKSALNIEHFNNRGLKASVIVKESSYIYYDSLLNENNENSFSQSKKSIAPQYQTIVGSFISFGNKFILLKSLTKTSENEVSCYEVKFPYSCIRCIEFEDESSEDKELYELYQRKQRRLKTEKRIEEQRLLQEESQKMDQKLEEMVQEIVGPEKASSALEYVKGIGKKYQL